MTDLYITTETIDVAPNHEVRGAKTLCFHCGTKCDTGRFHKNERTFCCQGCLAVFELLTDAGLANFYAMDERAGVRVSEDTIPGRFAYLDEPPVRERLVSFSNNKITRITVFLPAIHCAACVWLLENLFRLDRAIGKSEVNFLRREATIAFDPNRLKLSGLVSVLSSLGYEPEFKFSDLDGPRSADTPRKLWIQLGIAGFAFGNNMLFSLALYLGVDGLNGPAFQKLVGYLSMTLAIPVLLYSAQDFFRQAWIGLKQRLFTIEVPIAVGILVIFGQSAWEVVSGHGEGYFDSFAGLLFFLLCGRLFQQKTYARLAFDRDFKSFFPLSVTQKTASGSASIPLSELVVGDRLLIRNGELVPADARLLQGPGLIDYSFVTGESEPVEIQEGDYLYAGGRQIGCTIEIETSKEVSQSYLTSLWNQDAFKKPNTDSLDTLINRYSQRFTKIVVAVAFGAAVFWSFADSRLALKAFTSVLIVACPCALALATPFTLGTAIRVLGRCNIFVKNPHTIEKLAKVDSVVFDKTGTLTVTGAASMQFEGVPLTQKEERWIFSLTRHSTHPNAVRICQATNRNYYPEEVRSFLEVPGCGIEATIAGHEILMGSDQWLTGHDVAGIKNSSAPGSNVHLAIDRQHRGIYSLPSALRNDVQPLLHRLSGKYLLALLSGDNDKERAAFEKLFGRNADLNFNQSPSSKLEFIENLQKSGKRVMMVGDGLNDAGALKQSDIGIAVVENAGAFSPASDIILLAGMVPRVDSVLQFSKRSVAIVRTSFLVSSLYNLAGISIAAAGLLAPIVCAILMPLSSISVVAFACAATTWAGHKSGLFEDKSKASTGALA